MKKNNFVFIVICFFYSLNLINAQTGKSLNFDGINDQINCGNHSSIDITGSHITLEAVVKIDNFQNASYQNNIINKEGTPHSGYMLRAGGAGVVDFNISDGTNWYSLSTPNNTLTLNTWHSIAATYGGSKMKIYVDGVEVNNVDVSGVNIASTSVDLLLGRWSHDSDRHFSGSMDEVRIWNVTRNAAQIAANHDTQLTLPQTGLVAYYQFNQGIAGGNNTTETTLIDATGNNNGSIRDFTLTGSTSNWVSDATLSYSQVFKNKNIIIHPNPSSDFLQISNLDEPTQYKIYNIIGSKISDGNVINNNQKINIKHLDKGIYFLNLSNNNSFKFIKN